MALGKVLVGAPSMLSTFALSDILRPISRKFVLIYFAAVACLGFSLPASAERPTPGVRSIQLVQHVNGVKVVYQVMLDWRFKVDELDTLAHRIKRAAPKTQMISILYFLNGMNPELEAWATSDFNPSLNSFVLQINEAATVTNVPAPDSRIQTGQ